MQTFFDYNASTLAGVERTPIHGNPFYTVSEVVIPSPVQGNIPAYYVCPEGKGPWPAVLFLHPAISSKDHFLEDARALAKQGIASLLIDAPMARPDPWKQVGSIAKPEVERELYIHTVKDLRRSLDFLLAEREVDNKRIAFVGQGYGASLGGVLAGVDKRCMAYVLIAGIPNLSQFWERSTRPIALEARKTITQEQITRYVESTREFAAVNFIGKAAPAALFFQFAKWDNWVTKAMALQFYDAASSPKKIRFYDTDQKFTAPESKTEYMEWIRSRFFPPEKPKPEAPLQPQTSQPHA